MKKKVKKIIQYYQQNNEVIQRQTQKQDKIQYNQNKMHQQNVNNNEMINQNKIQQNVYQITQQWRSTIIKTIQLNIQCDYENEYSQINLHNVKIFYQDVYKQSDNIKAYQKYKNLKKLWQQNKVQFQTQLNILEWFQNGRGKIYDYDNIIGVPKQSQKSSQKIQKQRMQKNQINKMISYLKLCIFTKNLDKSKIKQNKELKDKIFNIWEQVEIDGIFYNVGWSQKYIGKQVLFQYKYTMQNGKQIKKQKQNFWVVQITNDMRYIWRASIPINKYNVETLLKFILVKRQKNQKRIFYIDYCPTIVINAGSHGMENGVDAFESGNQQQLDQRIIDQTQQTIAKLLQQINKRNKQKNNNIEKFKLNQPIRFNKQQNKYKTQFQLTDKNIMTKIHINYISLERNAVYPIKANHIIDCHCSGAHSMIKAKYLQPSGKSHQQKDLLFLFQPNNIEQLMFWQSSIITKKNDQEKLLSFFGGKDKIKRVTQLFKASDHGFQLKKFWNKCGHYPHLFIICVTNKNNIIGAYSPLSHMNENQKNEKKQTPIIDITKTSFLFSLTNGHQFKLVNPQYAALIRKGKKYICFGNDEFRICDYSNTNNDCMTLINNGGYYNQNYILSNPWIFDKDSCRRFNGNEGVNFTTKQWEAWKIQLKQ